MSLKLNKIDFFGGFWKKKSLNLLTFFLSETLMGMSAHGAILQNMKMEYIGNTVRFHPAEVRAPCISVEQRLAVIQQWVVISKHKLG